MHDENFQARCFSKDTWIITGAGCDCYLLIGEDEAVMIDSGCSTANIQAFAQTLTDVPVRSVINTHSHFDHTGGNGYFERVLTTRGVARGAKNTMGGSPYKYPLSYDFTCVKDGDIIDLKGRPLTIIVLDCHSPENLAVLDRKNRLLFPGDELEAGQVLLLPGYAEVTGQVHARPAATVETYLHAMQKLAGLGQYFDTLCPGHNGAPLSPCYLEWYIELAQKVLNGMVGSPDCSSLTYHPTDNHFPFPHANYARAEWKGASLIYCKDLIRDKDILTKDDSLPATTLHLLSAYCI